MWMKLTGWCSKCNVMPDSLQQHHLSLGQQVHQLQVQQARMQQQVLLLEPLLLRVLLLLGPQWPAPHSPGVQVLVAAPHP
jgi:hypothetical protein